MTILSVTHLQGVQIKAQINPAIHVIYAGNEKYSAAVHFEIKAL